MAAKKFKDLAESLYNDEDAASLIEKHKQEMRDETAAYQLAELRRSLGLGQSSSQPNEV